MATLLKLLRKMFNYLEKRFRANSSDFFLSFFSLLSYIAVVDIPIKRTNVSNNEVSVWIINLSKIQKLNLQTSLSFSWLYSWLFLMSLRVDIPGMAVSDTQHWRWPFPLCPNRLFLRVSQPEERWLKGELIVYVLSPWWPPRYLSAA